MVEQSAVLDIKKNRLEKNISMKLEKLYPTKEINLK